MGSEVEGKLFFVVEFGKIVHRNNNRITTKRIYSQQHLTMKFNIAGRMRQFSEEL